MTLTHPHYWLDRYNGAVECAALASGDRSRSAYTDLARHYWSMHEMVAGRSAAPAAHAIGPLDPATARCAA